MTANNNRESLRSIVISYEEYQRLKTIESRFEELQKERAAVGGGVGVPDLVLAWVGKMR